MTTACDSTGEEKMSRTSTPPAEMLMKMRTRKATATATTMMRRGGGGERRPEDYYYYYYYSSSSSSSSSSSRGRRADGNNKRGTLFWWFLLAVILLLFVSTVFQLHNRMMLWVISSPYYYYPPPPQHQQGGPAQEEGFFYDQPRVVVVREVDRDGSSSSSSSFSSSVGASSSSSSSSTTTTTTARSSMSQSSSTKGAHHAKAALLPQPDNPPVRNKEDETPPPPLPPPPRSAKITAVVRAQKVHQPIRRSLQKLYYLSSGDVARTAYMEHWLSQQSKLPHQAIPIILPPIIQPPSSSSSNGSGGGGGSGSGGGAGRGGDDWPRIYLQVVEKIRQEQLQLQLQPNSNATAAAAKNNKKKNKNKKRFDLEEQNGLVLILQDDFKVFHQTLGRLERALKWLPDDFDIARIDCFDPGNAGNTTLVSQENRRDFVQIYQPQQSTNHTNNNNALVVPQGGLHAMVWRISRLDRIQAFLEEVASSSLLWSLDCALATPSLFTKKDLNLYCLNFDSEHRIGCFHHWKPPIFSFEQASSSTATATATSSSSTSCNMIPLSDQDNIDISSIQHFERSLLSTPWTTNLGLDKEPLMGDNDKVAITPASSASSASASSATTFMVSVAGTNYTYRAIVPHLVQDAMHPAAVTTDADTDTGNTAADAIQLLVGICSANTNFAQRQALRLTWAALPWRAYFIVAGRNQSVVQDEFDYYQDLIWVDVEEHYKTGLTPKTMAFLHFANTLFSLAAPRRKSSVHDETSQEEPPILFYAFKTDDDMYVNITQLQLDLARRPAAAAAAAPQNNTGMAKRTITGTGTVNIDYFGLPMEHTGPVRDTGSKFYLSPEEYPSESFPTYATGGGYALSSRFLACAVQQMSTTSRNNNMTGMMWWEDVAVGLLAEACQVSLTPAPWDPKSIRAPGSYFRSLTTIHKNSSRTSHMITSSMNIAHRVSIENQYRIHHGLPLAIHQEDGYKTSRMCPELED